jgi:hypothetical protein
MDAELFAKAKALAVELLDKTAGEMSLHEIAKHLNNRLGTPIQPGELAQIRMEWWGRMRQSVLAHDRQEKAKEKLTGPRCSNCGGAHYISQCTEPFPEKPLQLVEVAEKPEEIVEKLEAPATQPQEKAMDSSPKAEVIVTAPHPDARKRSVAGMMLRRQWLNDALDKDPGADPLKLLLEMRERFGVGIDSGYLYDTCRVARELNGLPQIPERGEEKRSFLGHDPLPTFGSPPVDELAFADNPDDECRWLAQQANDIMRAHALTELRLVVEGGKAKWIYKVVKTGEGEVTL